jgi:hypothetical protein
MWCVGVLDDSSMGGVLGYRGQRCVYFQPSWGALVLPLQGGVLKHRHVMFPKHLFLKRSNKCLRQDPKPHKRVDHATKNVARSKFLGMCFVPKDKAPVAGQLAHKGQANYAKSLHITTSQALKL